MRLLLLLPALLAVGAAGVYGRDPSTACVWGSECKGSSSTDKSYKPNVLFLNIDDLNDFPEDRFTDVDTPNITALAARGAKFTNAFSNSPMCFPSRTSLLTGISTETSGLAESSSTATGGADFRLGFPALTERPSLPQWFKERGYEIHGAGKLFHLPNDDASSAAPNARLTVWDSTYEMSVGSGGTTLGLFIDDFDVPGGRPTNGLTGLMLTDPDGLQAGIPSEIDWGYFEYSEDPDTYTGITDSSTFPDRTDDTPDSDRAEWAIAKIDAARATDTPQFISLGFYRPHLPLYCPKKHFDQVADAVTRDPYLSGDRDDDIYKPHNGTSVDNDLRFAGTRDHADSGYYLNEKARSYFACVEFVDELVGDLLTAIDASGEEWMIVLWGDHGWHLGSKQAWQKFTLWDRGGHTTLAVVGPGITPGTVIDDAVGLIDVFPTMTELAGINNPSGIEGRSLTAYMTNSFVSPSSVRIDWTSVPNTWVAYTSERYNYIIHEDGTTEFYDKQSDPNEQTNLDHPANGCSPCPDPQYDDEKAELMENSWP